MQFILKGALNLNPKCYLFGLCVMLLYTNNIPNRFYLRLNRKILNGHNLFLIFIILSEIYCLEFFLYIDIHIHLGIKVGLFSQFLIELLICG